MSASVTLNFNKWIGVVGELGGGVGMRQDLTFNAATLPNPNPDVREFIHPKALAIGEMLPRPAQTLLQVRQLRSREPKRD